MDHIEHPLATAGFDIEQRVSALRRRVLALDAPLAPGLDEVLTVLEDAGERLVGIVGTSHGIDRG